MAINKGVLAKDVDGAIEYIYPKTSADIVKYDNNNSVKATLDTLKETKVDKVENKYLSSNDFSNEHKTVVDKLLENDNYMHFSKLAFSKEGIHGIRFFENKLEVYDHNNNRWITLVDKG